LITKGLYRFSRNPIYLFLLAGLAGLFLILPNAITLSVVFASYHVLQVTMRVEESFLTKHHGEKYLDYKSHVRRLL
jgi:protein-S-isoprenylcysteine O-methyltransferase Ste14